LADVIADGRRLQDATVQCQASNHLRGKTS
jgi:hypothetical protein